MGEIERWKIGISFGTVTLFHPISQLEVLIWKLIPGPTSEFEVSLSLLLAIEFGKGKVLLWAQHVDEIEACFHLLFPQKGFEGGWCVGLGAEMSLR